MSDIAIGRALDWRFAASVVSQALLPIWFIAYSGVTAIEYIDKNYLGLDVLLYRNAAIAAIDGGNPWAIQPTGFAFAGPPMTLLFYVPLALMPLSLATLVVMAAGVGASLWAVRRLDLPIWWIFFPPIFEAIIVGNPDVIVLALLLVPGPIAGLAAGLKVYAVIPLIAQRRWTALVIAGSTVLVSAPLIPRFLSSLHTVATQLEEQAAGISAWGTILLVPTVAALILVRRHGAEWLIVPGIWPNTQGHYSAMAVPAVRNRRLVAAILGLNTPLAPPLGVMIFAVQRGLEERRRRAAPLSSAESMPTTVPR